jgi:hypothetical protein
VLHSRDLRCDSNLRHSTQLHAIWYTTWRSVLNSPLPSDNCILIFSDCPKDQGLPFRAILQILANEGPTFFLEPTASGSNLAPMLTLPRPRYGHRNTYALHSGFTKLRSIMLRIWLYQPFPLNFKQPLEAFFCGQVSLFYGTRLPTLKYCQHILWSCTVSHRVLYLQLLRYNSYAKPSIPASTISIRHQTKINRVALHKLLQLHMHADAYDRIQQFQVDGGWTPVHSSIRYELSNIFTWSIRDSRLASGLPHDGSALLFRVSTDCSLKDWKKLYPPPH